MQHISIMKHGTLSLPRGWYIFGLAMLSWALVVAGWTSVAASMALLLG